MNPITPKISFIASLLVLLALLSACAPETPTETIQITVPTALPTGSILPTAVPPTFTAVPPDPTQPEPTLLPTPTHTPLVPELPPLDHSNLTSVMAWMNVLLKTRAAEEIDRVIGPQGALFAPYAVGAFPPGYDNGPEIAAELEMAFAGAEPVCRGYDPNFGTAPDKAALYVQGLNFDWPALGLPAESTGINTFQFFNLEGFWQLTFIVPMPDWGLPDFSTLQPCP